MSAVAVKDMKNMMPSRHVVFRLLSEFMGTIFITWMIALLGVSFNGHPFEVIISQNNNTVASHLVIGFWVALDVALCLAIFSRWSCDLNPAVTLYRILAKQNTLKYGLAKLGVQTLAGFTVGGIIIGTQMAAHDVSKNALDSVASGTHAWSWSAFLSSNPVANGNVAGNSAGKHFLALFGEFVGTFGLVFMVFTKQLKVPLVRDMLIVLWVGFGVTALLEIGSVGWNPARSLGTTFAHDVAYKNTDASNLYWAYLFGPLLASVALWELQKHDVAGFFNRHWETWSGFLNINRPAADPNAKSKKMHFQSLQLTPTRKMVLA